MEIVGCERIYTRYDMRATLASGQTFAFTEEGGSFYGIADGRPVEIRGSDGGYDIIFPPGDAGFWRRYFDLDRPYDAMLKPFLGQNDGTAAGSTFSAQGESALSTGCGSAFLSKCVGAFGGLRLLRQPVWETLCAFIISANNNLKRIGSIYRRISGAYGAAVEWAGRTYNAFPAAGALAAAGEQGLRGAGLGYRAPYLLDTARAAAAGGLPDLDAMAYGDALKYLMKFRGVGEKVADCVLLFSTSHQQAFPVDVWIERALRERYGMDGTRRELKLEAQKMFGGAAGVAQQFLFHGMRSNLI